MKEAVRPITIATSRGRPKLFGLMERTMLFLFIVLIRSSNRYCESSLEFFQPFLKFRVNYKYIERLYSDELVKLVLHNVFFSLIQLEGISGKFSGDGTGYSIIFLLYGFQLDSSFVASINTHIFLAKAEELLQFKKKVREKILYNKITYLLQRDRMKKVGR